MDGGRGVEVPLIDGLPATYNQSLTVEMAVQGLQLEDAVYRIDLSSALASDPWSVTKIYEDVRVSHLPLVGVARSMPNRHSSGCWA